MSTQLFIKDSIRNRRRNKEKTRKEITRAAIKIFTKQGFVKTSTLEIAKEAKVAHGTVFFHFPTRAELMIESIYRTMDKLAYELDLLSRKTTDLRKLCRLFLREISIKETFYSRLVRDLPQLPLDIQRLVFASLSGFSTHFVEVIERGQKKGNFRNITPKTAVFYWFGMVNYLYSYPELLGTKKITKNEETELIDFFIKALKNRG
ncbi:TetR/AcrR family transcriptional regulator [Candidatus Dojkabacteria bacterium]|nr:TetR/AcrR family transcriptional regulator [Candidatus Dojkabacteria bacterium]